MAIKGKRKPKARSPRGVTPGPRPAYVPPKIPLFARTGAKFTVVLIIQAIFFLTLVGFGEESEADLEQARINEYTTLLQAALDTASGLISPLPGSAELLPDLPSRIGEVKAGEADADAITTEAEGWAETLDSASTRVLQVRVDYEDLEIEQRLDLAAARDDLERGMRMYAGLCKQLVVAVQIEGEPQQDLIASMEEQLTVAAGAFQSGFGLLQEVRRQAGLDPITITPAAGLPGQSVPGLPGGLPEGLPGGLPEGLPEGVVPAEPPAEPPADEGGGGGGGGNG